MWSVDLLTLKRTERRSVWAALLLLRKVTRIIEKWP
jgi:hypothetical protein